MHPSVQRNIMSSYCDSQKKSDFMMVESTAENSERDSNGGKNWRHFQRRRRLVIESSSSPEKMIEDAILRVEPVEASTTVLGVFVLWRQPSPSWAELKREARKILDILKIAVLHSHCQSASSTLLMKLDAKQPSRRVNSRPKVFSSRCAPVL